MHTLHSKDTWLKQARVVRLGEVPYKVTAPCPREGGGGRSWGGGQDCGGIEGSLRSHLPGRNGKSLAQEQLSPGEPRALQVACFWALEPPQACA